MRRVGQVRRRDALEPFIVEALESIGIVVRCVSGESMPDLLTYSRSARLWLPVEVKRPGGSLTPAQQELYELAPFPVVESVAEALSLYGVR